MGRFTDKDDLMRYSIIMITVVVCTSTLGCTSSSSPERPFNVVEWNNDQSQAGQRGARSEMIDSLLESKILANLPRRRVIETLGNPYKQPEENKLTGDLFFVGADRQFGIDNEWILVTYNEQQRVSNVQLIVQ